VTRPGHPAAVLGLLADGRRLAVLGAVALGPRSADEIADATRLARADVDRALVRLVDGGVVVETDDGYAVADDVAADAARAAGRMRPRVEPEDLGATDEQASVLCNFFDDGRLTSIPASHAKRRVVLDFLAVQFEPGKVYPEAAVNDILGRFHPDFASLRRYLVDEEFLERRDAFYWRAGGTFEVD
jgi:DNA-binding transcriptional ArsR family regulator